MAKNASWRATHHGEERIMTDNASWRTKTKSDVKASKEQFLGRKHD
ncbi:hypothetical protein LQZ18_16385 [Lachnospiraceae bacterium ZAX-1]